MKKSIFIYAFLILFSSCITIMRGIDSEKIENYPIEKNIKPSELILQYTQIAPNPNKNYVVVCQLSGCRACIYQVPYVNKLHEKYGKDFTFLATTNEDSLRTESNLSKLEKKDRYNFNRYYNIWGLQSSLRSLHAQQNPNFENIKAVPTNFIIKNDSIVHVLIRGISDQDAASLIFEEFLK